MSLELWAIRHIGPCELRQRRTDRGEVVENYESEAPCAGLNSEELQIIEECVSPLGDAIL